MYGDRMAEYRIVRTGGTGEYEEKKSRFIARLCPVKDENEASELIASVKKQYWDAKHNCYAFVIGKNNEISRCSDDGEPSGTAGRPLLETLVSEGIHDAVVVVTRYFGGTLLGTGGLVRAYTQALKEAIASSEIVPIRAGMEADIVFSYADVGAVKNYIEAADARICAQEYGADVTYTCAFEQSVYDDAVKKIKDLTGGKVQISEPRPVEIDW